MKTKSLRFFTMMLAVFFIMGTVIGCSSQPSNSGNSSTGSDSSSKQPSNSSTGTDTSSKPAEVKQIKLMTASTSGAFYPIGGVAASILSKNMEGHNFTAEASGGSEENARLIHAGKAQIGLFGGDTIYNAYHGKNNFEGQKIDLRSIARIYSNPFHIVVLKDSGINKIEDLEGKSVAVGKPGSGTSAKAEILLGEHGLKFGDNIKEEYLGFKEGSEGLIDGIVDAVIISVGLPSGSVQELGASHEIKLLSFSEEKAKEIAKKYPYFSEEVIPAGTYEGIDDVLTMGSPNEIGVPASLDEELVYQITKILFDTHFADFQAGHAAMKDVKVERAGITGIPLHPGAERFYKEKGFLK
jgi:TRAP transporter TAXI family solute receptor